MGCFSFLCKECGKGIRSTSFSGERCKLYLLKDGEVFQTMEGQYDSYGAVFIEGSQRADVKHELMDSVKWNDPFPDKPRQNEREDNWSRVCRLIFDKDESNGIAAVHTKCCKGVIPTTRSDHDPNQGWGDDDQEDLFGNTDTNYDFD